MDVCMDRGRGESMYAWIYGWMDVCMDGDRGGWT